MSESNTCKMYTNATIAQTTKLETNAGICPKTNKTLIPGSISPPATPVPENERLCGKDGEICTFPFIFNSVTYFEPYKDATRQSKCGTKDDESSAETYDEDDDDLDPAMPCSGEYLR